MFAQVEGGITQSETPGGVCFYPARFLERFRAAAERHCGRIDGHKGMLPAVFGRGVLDFTR